MELDVLRIALVVLLIGRVILAHGVIDTDGVEPEVVLVLRRLVEEARIRNTDHRGVLTVIKTANLHDGNLIQCIIAVLTDNPLPIFILLIAIVIVHCVALHRIARSGRALIDIDKNCSGGVVGQGDDVEAGACKGEGRGGPLGFALFISVRSHGDLGGGAHGELAAVGIGRVIAVDILSIRCAAQLLERLIDVRLRGAVRHLRPDPLASIIYLCNILCTVHVRERREAVLVVNTRRGDDGQIIGRRIILARILIRARIRNSNSVGAIDRLIQDIINAIIRICVDSRIKALSNRHFRDVGVRKRRVDICFFNVQRQSEIDHKGFLCLKLIIQIHYSIAGFFVCIGERVIRITILRTNLGHFLQLPVNCLRYVFNIRNGIVNQASIAIGKVIVESSSTRNRNIIAIERQRCIAFIVVVDRQGILGYLCADIDPNQFSATICNILQLINLRNPAHRLIPNCRFRLIIVGRSKCFIATISRRSTIRYSYFPDFIVTILRKANGTKDSRIALGTTIEMIEQRVIRGKAGRILGVVFIDNRKI